MFVPAAPPAAVLAAPGCNDDAGSSSALSAGAEHRTSAGRLGYTRSTTGRHSQG